MVRASDVRSIEPNVQDMCLDQGRPEMLTVTTPEIHRELFRGAG